MGYIPQIFGGVLVAICGISLHEFLATQFNLGVNNHGRTTSAPSELQARADIDIDIQQQQQQQQRQENFSHPSSSYKPFLLVGDTDTKIDIITESINELKIHWNEFKPWLLGSSGVALVCGIVQVLSSVCILCAGGKVSFPFTKQLRQ